MELLLTELLLSIWFVFVILFKILGQRQHALTANMGYNVPKRSPRMLYNQRDPTFCLFDGHLQDK
jgi:hypothetical protein